MIEKRARRDRAGRRYHVWRVRFYDATGRERSRTFRAEEDARSYGAKVTLAKRAGELTLLDSGRETMADFAERWWRDYATPNLERSTLRSYANHWNLHGLDRLGGHRVREITPQVVTAFRAELETAGVGAATIRRTMAVLQSMFARAVEWELVRYNPVAAVRKPPAARKRAVRPLPPDDVERLRSVLSLRDAGLVSVLAYAGVRPQEALALTWEHVRERTLLVEAAVSFGQLKGQKTRRPPRTVALLGPLRQDLAELRLAAGPGQLIFPSGAGELWRDHDYRNWRTRVFQEAAAAVGLGEVTIRMVAGRRRRSYRGVIPYDLRHSFASLRLHEGASAIDVADELGHSKAMTLSTYAHVIAELADGPRRPAEDEIRRARARVSEADAAHIRPTGTTA